MANKKLNYVKQSKIESLLKKTDYLLMLGARGNGKSYSAKNLIIKKCIETGKEMIYLRRYDLDCKDSVCVSYFGDCPVESMTDGEYACIDVFRKGIFLANINPDTGKIERGRRIGYCHALSNQEHYKSLAFPNVDYIIYEEIVSFDGRYLYNECNKLQQYISTIFRSRDNGKCILIGNTISRLCPYYREWDLHIERLEIGKTQLYTYHNENGNDTRITVYMTEPLNYNSGMFFGNASKNITAGAYEVNEQPHLPKSIIKYKILYTLVVEYDNFKFLCQLLQDKEDSNKVTWYVQPKTSDIQKETRIVSNKFYIDPLVTNDFTPLTMSERKVFNMFDDGKVCFSDNLTGTEFNNILKNFM